MKSIPQYRINTKLEKSLQNVTFARESFHQMRAFTTRHENLSIVGEPINFTLSCFMMTVKVHKKRKFSGYGQKSDLSTTICASGLNPDFWSKAHLRMIYFIIH